MAPSRIPPLLEPYLRLPPETSLLLLTSVLGASTNWLALRFLCTLLTSPTEPSEGGRTLGSAKGGLDDRGGHAGDQGSEEIKVVFVSFLRDWGFWREGARRLGLDLERIASEKRFAFVDGLSGLFGGLAASGQQVRKSTSVSGKAGEKVLTDSPLQSVRKEISNSILDLKAGSEDQSISGGSVVLVIDQIDFLLAASEGATPWGLGDMILELREQIHTAVLTLSADYPLVSVQQTPLETDHASFLLSLAHQACLIMSLRSLESGMAKDVSGVLRITGGGGAAGGDMGMEEREEKEMLYYVGGDGGVKVFERGA